ncbi:YpzI family protein [Cytobacillus gottheilii]|nr:YpzI family protein [Cytobacillus gottheilii]
MGRDRQEKKLKNSGRVKSDRDQALHYPGATKLQSPEEARSLNDNRKTQH